MKIAVIGLGYVGMPLAVEFSKKYPVVGFDINEARVKELQGGSDRTREIDSSSLKFSTKKQIPLIDRFSLHQFISSEKIKKVGFSTFSDIYFIAFL